MGFSPISAQTVHFLSNVLIFSSKKLGSTVRELSGTCRLGWDRWDVTFLDVLGHGELKKLTELNVYTGFKISSIIMKGKLNKIEFEHPYCLILLFQNEIQ